MALSDLGPIKTRRELLADAATLGVGAMVFGSVAGVAAAADKPKSTQKAVSYQDHPKAGKSCNTCNAFQGPNKCKTVEGYIEARGWCDKYKANA